MKKLEIWKSIPDFPNYEASTEGRIRQGGTILYTCINNSGYEVVCLWKNNHRHCFPVHRLVAKTFIPNPYSYTDVDHINNDKSNNSIDNLQWMNHRDNCRKYYDEKKYRDRILLSVAQGHWVNIYSGNSTSYQGTYTTPMNITIDYYSFTGNLITELSRVSSLFPDYIFGIHTDAGNLYIQGNRKVR